MAASTRRPQRWRFFVAVLGPVALCLIIAAGAALGFVLWSAGGIDERAVAQQSELARHVIATQLESIPHDQESVTIWDDSITHTKLEIDHVWIDANLGSWMYSFFGHDEVVILDDKNRPIYDMTEGKEVSVRHAEGQLEELLPLIADLRRKIAGGGIDAFVARTAAHPPRVSDLVVVAGVPSLVSIAPIISDTGAIKQARGTEYLHVSMVHLDADYGSRLSAQYMIPDVRFTQYTTADPHRFMLPLTNAAGRFITFFDWTKSSPGEAIVQQTVPVIAGAFLVAMLIAIGLIGQLWRKQRALDIGRAEVEHTATHDGLTGLANRANFEQILRRALAQHPGHERRISVLMLDLDRFKRVNDTLGHAAGDNLIRAVAQRLKQFLQPADLLARLSGDEFAIIHSHPPGTREPTLLAQRIIDAIGKPFDVFGSEAFVGVSIGIATIDGEDTDSRELIRKADIALYEAKTGGRNRAVIFEDAMSELLQNRHTIEAELREALRRSDQLSVAFQPLFGEDHRRIVGAEALARWVHPRLGQVSPAHFIPVAETSGLISPLGEFVLRRACTLGAKWPGHTFAVNISPPQLRDPEFPGRVFDILRETGMRAGDLELEITEGILLEETTISTEAIDLFRSAGIKIALDDFGTGYSSLNYLKRSPVDRIKIDRSFVSQLAPGSVSVPIVQAMVSLAHALKIEVTAEGVETREQIAVLEEFGINIYQGFLLSPPVSPAYLEVLLRLNGGAEMLQSQVA